MTKYTIYQAPFHQTAMGFKPDAEYSQVWEGEIDPAPYNTTELLLEAIWTQFQRVDEATGPWPPDGYEGRSLSIGDVVLVTWKSGLTTAYSPEVVGWAEAHDFRVPEQV